MRELLAILPGLFIGGRKVAGSPALWGGSVVPVREGAEPVGGVCVLDGTKHGYPVGGCHVVPDICVWWRKPPSGTASKPFCANGRLPCVAAEPHHGRESGHGMSPQKRTHHMMVAPR